MANGQMDQDVVPVIQKLQKRLACGKARTERTESLPP
jgi:hypothetical protein